MSVLWLREDLARGWADRDPFVAVAAQQGEMLKLKDGRRTLRFVLDGRSYVLKHHPGAGWREILKNLLQWRWPVLDARQEVHAARALAAVGVPSLVVAGFGVRGRSPAQRSSFVVTEDLGARISLEQLAARWRSEPPLPRAKRLLIARAAQLARTMHAAGVNHRDFYLCHLLLDEPTLASARHAGDIDLRIIDLHRAEVRGAVPRRWRIKDLAALAFSARAIGLTSRDRLRFACEYLGVEPREARQQRLLWRAVERRTRRLCRREAHSVV